MALSKKIIALILAAFLIATDIVPVFAANDIEPQTGNTEIETESPSSEEPEENFILEEAPNLLALPEPAKYNITTNITPAGNANVVLSKDNASAGEKITFTIENNSKLSVSKVFTEPEVDLTTSGDGFYSFEMPESDIVINVELSNDIPTGDFIISADEPLADGTDYSYSDGRLVILTDKSISIRNADPGVSTSDHIYIPANVSASLVLCGVNIRTDDYDTPAICIADDNNQTVRLSLSDGTWNSLYASQASAINKSNPAGRLIIDGGGYLDARNDVDMLPVIGCKGVISAPASAGGIEINSGHLYISTITKRDASNLAYTGIGGGYNASASDIFINGGEITFDGFRNPVGGGYDPYMNYSGSENIVFSKAASIKAASFENAVPVAEGGSTEALVLCSELPLTDGMELSIDGTRIPATTHDDGVTGMEQKRYIYLTPASEDDPHTVMVAGRKATYIYYKDGEWLSAEGQYQEPIRFTEEEVKIALQDYSAVPYDGNTLINNNVGSVVRYSSNNGNIATVDSEGKVTPIAGGTVVITALSKKDGCPDVKASYTMTIKEKHTIRVLSPEHGTAKVEPSYAIEGEEIAVLVVESEDGYEFAGYSLVDMEHELIEEGTGNSFVMPDKDAVIICKFEKPSVQIIIRQDPSGHGIAKAVSSARPGETVYVSSVSETGYNLWSFNVLDQEERLVYTNVYTGKFIMPDDISGKVYIVPKFELNRYRISAESVSHGNVEARDASEEKITSAVMGETVELKATADPDYELSSLSVLDSAGNNVTYTDKGGGYYEFAMPASDVTVKPVFTRISHDIRIEVASLDGVSGMGGIVKAFNESSEQISSAVTGEKVTLRAYPESDYAFSYLSSTPDVTLSRTDDIMYTFEMPAEEVLIKAAFEKTTQEGTREQPWNIGIDANPGGITAYIGGDNALYIQKGEGVAIMKDFDTDGHPAPYVYSIHSIKEIDVPEGVPNIGNYAFYNPYGVSHLTEISLPDSLTYIGKYAFSGFSTLEKLTIPADVNTIGENCFAGDTSLHTIVFEGKPDDFEGINEKAFSGVTADVYVPASWLSPDGTFDPSAYQFGGNLTYFVEGTDTQHVVNVRQPEHGIIECDKNIYNPGDTVAVTLKNSDDGYGWYLDRFFITPYVQYTVSSVSGGKQISFAMPDCDVEISASYISQGFLSEPWLIGYDDAEEGKYKDSVYAWCDADPADSSKKILYIKPRQENASMADFEEGAPWDIYADAISKVVVIEENGNALNNIGAGAFENLTSLTEANVGEGTKAIGKAAFSGCTSLEKVNMSGVTAADEEAFANCAALVSIDGTNLANIGQRAFYGCASFLGNAEEDGEALLDLNHAETIGKEAFCGCTSLKTVMTSSDVCTLEAIPEKAFSGCSSLVEVVLAKSVNSIGADAFRDCSSLGKFQISGYCGDIAPTAFLNDALRIRVTYDFLAARNDYDRLPQINDPGGKWYYGAKQLTYIVSPTPTARNNCAVKINQTKEGTVKLYKQGCTRDSGNWIEIVSSGSLWQGEITEIKVGGNVVSASAIKLVEQTYIKDLPGYERTRLFEFVMPTNAGDGKADVEFKISFVENATDDDYIGTEPEVPRPKRQGQPWDIAADGSSRVQAWLEDGTLYIESTAPPAYSFEMMDFTAGSTPWYSLKDEIKKVVIGDGVKSIGNYAFFDCRNLESVVIPDTVTKIGSEAFYASSVRRLNIPASVEELAQETFNGCKKLEEVNYEDHPSSIHSQAFRNANVKCYVNESWLEGGVTLEDLNDKDGPYQYSGTIEYVCASGKEYSITLNPSEGGTITLPFNKAAKGTLVVFDITPDYGYSYSKMTSTGVSVPYYEHYFIMPANDITLTPVFKKDHYYVYSDGGEGVSLYTGKLYYDVGETVEITSKTDSGYEITKIGVCENQGSRSVEVAEDGTFTMPAFDVRIFAESAKTKYKVTMNQTDDGFAFVNDSKGIQGEEIFACVNDTLALSATPVPGKKFKEWKIEALGEHLTTRENSYTMPACDITITPVFETPYSLTPAKTSGGKVTYDASYAFAGDTVKLSIRPEPGYKFDGWEEKPASLEIAEDGSFIMPEEDVYLKAKFARIENTYSIMSATDGNGTLEIAGESKNDEKVSFTASPLSGYRLKKVSAKAVSGASVMVLGNSFTMPESDVAVMAEFEKIPHKVNLIVSGGEYGSASLESPDIAGVGDIVQFSAAANADCRIDTMLISPWAHISDDDNDYYSFEMPDTDADIIIEFAPISGTETYPWLIGREIPENVKATNGRTIGPGIINTGLYITGNGTEEMMNFSDGGAPWSDLFGDEIGNVKFENVVNISDYALAGNYQLAEVDICEEVKSIGKGAFKGCEIRETDKIVFEGKPDRIEPDAFEGVEATVSVGRSWIYGGLTVDDLNRADGPYQFGGRLTYEVRSGNAELRLKVTVHPDDGETHGNVTVQAERTGDPNIYRADKGETVLVNYTADEGYFPNAAAKSFKEGISENIPLNPDKSLTLPGGDFEYVELEVVFIASHYEVTYDFCGRGSAEKRSWSYNEVIGGPYSVPVKEGYEIEGWYTDSDFTCKWNFASDRMPARDMTLYAKWVPKQYQVTWKNWDDTLLKTDPAVPYGAMPSYVGEIPEKGGAPSGKKYVFAGWDPTPANVTGPATYTATFEEAGVDSKTVIFDMNGHGDAATAPPVQTLTGDMYVTEPIAPSDSDYAFGGWYRDRACTEGEKWNFATDTVHGDITTLYAKWDIKTYEVTWKDYDGTVLLYQEAVPKGEYPVYTGETPIREATEEKTYTFEKWDPTVAIVSKNAIYTAVYTETPRSYIVNFDNGGKGKSPASQKVAVGGKITDPGSLTEMGYIFDGWYSDVTCSADSKWNFDTDTMPANAITLYAKWTPEMFKITWKDDDGSVLRVTTADYNTMPVYDGPKPYHAPDGAFEYEFTGWTPGLKRADRDETYTAVFDEHERQYVVTFDTNGKGKGGFSYKAVPGSIINKPEDPVAEEYTFLGWYKDAACSAGKEFDFDNETMPQANLTLYAKWAMKRFNVVWKNYNGDELQVDMNKPYGTIPQFMGATPTKPYSDTEVFIFDGWTPDIAPLTADVEYTAKFRSEPKILADISISCKPSKLIYLEGKDNLDVSGGKLLLTYNNGITEEIDITADMVSGFNNKKVGKQTLTVTYGGKTTTFDITIQRDKDNPDTGDNNSPLLWILLLFAAAGAAVAANIFRRKKAGN